jgi:acyl-CoA synthetase (AMP-forming)/AMP-acid ligase II
MILDVLARHVATRGTHPFLRHEGRSVSYAEFDHLANRAGHTLRSLGVTRGDRVTLALGNSVDYVVAAFGVLKAGAVLNPVNPGLGLDELRYILGHAEPRLVVTDPSSDARMREPGARTVGAESLAAHGPETAPDGPPVADDVSTLLYTSGTTGRPKGVVFTHGRSGTSGPHFIAALGLVPDV